MKSKQIWSVVIVLALLVAVPILTNELAKRDFDISISALEDNSPRSIVVSDVKDDSFRVSWVTERAVIGGISLEDGTLLNETDSSSFHSIDVTNLVSGQTYNFKLLSGTVVFGIDPAAPDTGIEEGDYFTVTLASQDFGNDVFLIYGQVFSPDGYTFQQGGVIKLVLESNVGSSQILSTKINETGGYQFDLGGISSNTLQSSFSYNGAMEAVFTLYISHDQVGIEKRYPVNMAISRQIPNIHLGDVSIDEIPAIDGT